MIHVYTGKGKGKTTCALGLAIRAAGAGLKVFIAQFLKKGCYSECKTLKRIPNITLEQFGTGTFVRSRPSPNENSAARKGFERCRKLIASKKFDLVILDEFNLCLSLDILSLAEAEELIELMPATGELVFTGRDAPAQLLRMADLVSEIKEVRHYFSKGLKARKGIEF
jgi:cob(I)alamin adenosyltransferase